MAGVMLQEICRITRTVPGAGFRALGAALTATRGAGGTHLEGQRMKVHSADCLDPYSALLLSL